MRQKKADASVELKSKFTFLGEGIFGQKYGYIDFATNK